MKNKYSSLKELDSEPIFDALLTGVEGELKEHLRELMQDACHKYDHLFTDSFWFTEIFGGLPIEYVLPALRRVFASFFIQIPPLLKSDQRRVELFQLQFNLEEFLTEVSSKLQGCIQKLDDYEHIDKASTALHLIVDNYVGGKIILTRVDNITQVIRQIKLEKHFKI